MIRIIFAAILLASVTAHAVADNEGGKLWPDDVEEHEAFALFNYCYTVTVVIEDPDTQTMAVGLDRRTIDSFVRKELAAVGITTDVGPPFNIVSLFAMVKTKGEFSLIYFRVLKTLRDDQTGLFGRAFTNNV